MNCPRCKAVIGTLANPDSIVTCPGCGARLMTRSAAIRSQGAPKPLGGEPGSAFPPPPPAPASAPPNPRVELPPPSATLPGIPVNLLGLDSRSRIAEATALPSPSAPGGKDTASKRKGRGGAKEADAPVSATLEIVLRELQTIRETQQQILDALRGGARPFAAAHPSAGAAREDGLALSAIRTQRPKSVVLLDDDPRTRDAAVAELLRADVPVRAYDDGNAALHGIAEDKPDVIVIELGLEGEMAGKDVINMIKATMEWVDIPVILWTRESVKSQKEARQVHGADEVVPKENGAAALVARVITVFRRG
jgi:CheY-like chemotaxis protein/predicted RNA-binding Zn-ribbon protein involved in translation (DUF1610 family)